MISVQDVFVTFQRNNLEPELVKTTIGYFREHLEEKRIPPADIEKAKGEIKGFLFQKASAFRVLGKKSANPTSQETYEAKAQGLSEIAENMDSFFQ